MWRSGIVVTISIAVGAYLTSYEPRAAEDRSFAAQLYADYEVHY